VRGRRQQDARRDPDQEDDGDQDPAVPEAGVDRKEDDGDEQSDRGADAAHEGLESLPGLKVCDAKGHPPSRSRQHAYAGRRPRARRRNASNRIASTAMGAIVTMAPRPRSFSASSRAAGSDTAKTD